MRVKRVERSNAKKDGVISAALDGLLVLFEDPDEFEADAEPNNGLTVTLLLTH